MASVSTAAPTSPPVRSESVVANPPKEWTPRLWQGCDFFAWMRLLIRNHCDVRLPASIIYIPFVISCVSVVHTVFRYIQNTWIGGRVERTPVLHAPLFIIGHWRTGTTLLHELLILDPRHNYPNTYQCLAPNHFLLTEKIFTRLFRFLLPSRRPMDNMAAGWDRPRLHPGQHMSRHARSERVTVTVRASPTCA